VGEKGGKREEREAQRKKKREKEERRGENIQAADGIKLINH